MQSPNLMKLVMIHKKSDSKDALLETEHTVNLSDTNEAPEYQIKRVKLNSKSANSDNIATFSMGNIKENALI